MTRTRFCLASLAVLVSLPACNTLLFAEDRDTPSAFSTDNERRVGWAESASPTSRPPVGLADSTHPTCPGHPHLDVPGEEWLQEPPAQPPDRLRQDLDLVWEDYQYYYTGPGLAGLGLSVGLA